MLTPRNFWNGATARGFSLIELMISITIGLIVAAGAVTLIVAIDQANSETIQSTRLTQEVRALAGVIAADLKRIQRVSDPIAEVGQGTTANCPTLTTPVTPAQPCYTFSTDPTGATATQCVTYGYTGTLGTDITSGTVYNYRSVRRKVVNGVGTVVMDQTTIDPSTTGTALLTATQAKTCPIVNSTTYTLSSSEVDVSSLCFSSAADLKTCYYNSATGLCQLNTTTVTVPAANEIDVCITAKLLAGDTYAKTITRAFIQPVYVRSLSVN